MTQFSLFQVAYFYIKIIVQNIHNDAEVHQSLSWRQEGQ